MSKIIIALILTILIITPLVSTVVHSYTYVENEVYVDSTGNIISISLINVTSPPEAIVIPAYQPSAYLAYYTNNYQTMPIDFNGTDLIVLANETGILNVTYLSLAATSKQGIVWSINLSENYYTKIFLPQNSITININPTPISIYYLSGSPVILMPPGKIFIQYTIATTQTPSLHKQENYYIYFIVAIIAILIIVMLMLIKRKSKNIKEVNAELDERDKQIINAIKKLGGIATANQIMEETNIPKTPLYRRLSKLVEMGYIEEMVYGKTKKYKIKDHE